MVVTKETLEIEFFAVFGERSSYKSSELGQALDRRRSRNFCPIRVLVKGKLLATDVRRCPKYCRLLPLLDLIAFMLLYRR